MGNFVCQGATLQCSFGLSPSTLMITVPARPKCGNMLMGTIMDYIPMTNILSFGMCQSMLNPAVASATSAAMGVLTPQPCTPLITAPWAPGGQVKVMGQPALINNAKCMCNWGGQISVATPSGSMMTEGK
ncbi:protein of unknown function [Xylanibacter ruminicola]|uniref:DUF4280 domain-containing protein n=1 Tax=Xylanibacter ruminicola TaxID=839 RepID=A0A1H4EGC0_XYLRU|nr:DUF4280 domain-containing protein [Xylanibacter ruminicola]SEA83996.1 protein of unknown function [Xylanibacter ruminicola]